MWGNSFCVFFILSMRKVFKRNKLSAYGEYGECRDVCGTQNHLQIREKNLCVHREHKTLLCIQDGLELVQNYFTIYCPFNRVILTWSIGLKGKSVCSTIINKMSSCRNFFFVFSFNFPDRTTLPLFVKSRGAYFNF